jgi:hypothetical protein
VLKEYNTALSNTSFFLGFITTKTSVVESEEHITFVDVLFLLFDVKKQNQRSVEVRPIGSLGDYSTVRVWDDETRFLFVC